MYTIAVHLSHAFTHMQHEENHHEATQNCIDYIITLKQYDVVAVAILLEVVWRKTPKPLLHLGAATPQFAAATPRPSTKLWLIATGLRGARSRRTRSRMMTSCIL